MISVIFPDDSVKKFDKGVKVIDVAKSISEGLARKVISCLLYTSDAADES